MIEQGLVFYILGTLFLLMLLVISFAIPLYGLMRKRLKGLALGCLLQPLFCLITSGLVIAGIASYQIYNLKKLKNAAMVTVKETVGKGDDEQFCTWYLKPDGECLLDQKEADDEDGNYSGKLDARQLLDVIRLDSTSVCVDDRVVVRFDLAAHSVTATDYDEPMEIVSVDWERVTAFFRGRK